MNTNAKQLPSERHGIPANSTRTGAMLDWERQNTNSKHTPGKWTTKIRQPGTMLTVENETGEYVCSLLGGDEHKQENARLIAAAPAMLEALRAVAALANGQGRANLMEVAGQAQQIIAQAEGGAQ